jgi:hypothetical protein
VQSVPEKCCSHVPQYADIAAPLFNLTQKWGPDEHIAFQQLKDALLQDTILAHPWVEEEKWVVDTHASARAIDTVLAQEQDGVERVIRYASKRLLPAQQRYCTTQRELLAATWALK